MHSFIHSVTCVSSASVDNWHLYLLSLLWDLCQFCWHWFSLACAICMAQKPQMIWNIPLQRIVKTSLPGFGDGWLKYSAIVYFWGDFGVNSRTFWRWFSELSRNVFYTTLYAWKQTPVFVMRFALYFSSVTFSRHFNECAYCAILSVSLIVCRVCRAKSRSRAPRTQNCVNQASDQIFH